MGHTRSQDDMSSTQCSNILQAAVFVKRKRAGGVGTHFETEPDSHLLPMNMIKASNHLSVLAGKNVDSERDASSD